MKTEEAKDLLSLTDEHIEDVRRTLPADSVLKVTCNVGSGFRSEDKSMTFNSFLVGKNLMNFSPPFDKNEEVSLNVLPSNEHVMGIHRSGESMFEEFIYVEKGLRKKEKLLLQVMAESKEESLISGLESEIETLRLYYGLPRKFRLRWLNAIEYKMKSDETFKVPVAFYETELERQLIYQKYIEFHQKLETFTNPADHKLYPVDDKRYITLPDYGELPPGYQFDKDGA